MIDTHCHLYLAGDFPGDECYDAMNRAIASGVTRMVFPNVDRDSLEPIRRLHEVYPFNSAMAIGIHPTELHGDWEALLDEFEQLAPSPEFVAIGEVGIDLHFDDNPPLETQRRAFARQLDWAVKYDKPVIIHCRDARDEVLQCIVELRDRLPGNAPLPRLVFHSFTGTPDDVRAIRRVCDPMFGINGVGGLYLNSITFQDYDFFMLLSAFYTLVSLTAGIVIDISYGFIDPRIRMGAK